VIRRHAEKLVLDGLRDRPVVLIHGARQTGKSTLAQAVSAGRRRAQYVSLDDAVTLDAAQRDPQGFVEALDGPVVIDEVQRVPELFRAIKLAVDRKRRPGRFLLTGSANALLVPRVSESLAGRIAIITLWPLSQGEIEGRRESFVDALFGKVIPTPDAPPVPAADVFRRALRGGFPEVVKMRSDVQRQAWFEHYSTAILQRDVRELANIEGLAELPRLLSLLATRSAALLNVADVSRSLGLPHTSLNRYLTLLETTFLIHTLPAWSSNLGQRLVKAPKVVLCDTGLMTHLLAFDRRRLRRDPQLGGPLVESFVATEITKQLTWSRTRARLFHFRTHAGREVDLLLEDRPRRLVGIEVKASGAVSGADFAGLRALAELTGPRFHRGIVLYTGSTQVPFGVNLHAVPMGALWQWSKPPGTSRRRPSG